ncbi:MAG: MFS transporter [Calditrichaeota bacterium]|nr:MFS transporter [Calditrichota bacterium]
MRKGATVGEIDGAGNGSFTLTVNIATLCDSVKSPYAMNSKLAILFLTIFIDLLGFGLIIPALPFYAESFGASFLVIGILSASYSAMHFLFSPLWGRLSDRVGRRPVLLIGLAGSAAAFLMFGLAKSLFMLFAARILAGILSSATLPTAQAYIADSTSEADRAKGMGLIGAAFGLGFIFGPAVGGILTKYGYGFPALVASGMSALNFIWAYLKLPETHPAPGETESGHKSLLSLGALIDVFKTPVLGVLIAVFLIQVYAFSQMEATFALFCEHRLALDAVHVGWILAEVGIISAIVQGALMGKLVRAYGEAPLARTGMVLMAIGLGVMGFVQTTTQMIMVAPFLAVGSALMNPTINSLISKAAPEGKQGLTLGTAQSVASLGRVFGPPSGTALFQYVGLAAPYWVGALMVGAVATVKLRRK